MCKLALLVHLYFIYGSCQVIRAPTNMAVLVGDRLDMTCQPENGFIVRAWVYQPPFSYTDLKIYANWSVPRIHIDHFGYDTDIDDSINIYLNSTGLEDAGTYNCYVQLVSRQPESYSAQVIVLETEPVCEDVMSDSYNDTLKEGDVIWMRCSVNFRGNLAPIMEWRLLGESGEIDEFGRLLNGENETTDTNVTSTLFVSIKSTYNATFFTCKTYFQWDNTSSPNSTATNAPEYSHTWNSSVIFVAASNFVQKETTNASHTSLTTSGLNENLSTSTFDAFNAIYLVAGVAVIFGIASSLVALILCLRLRRKNSAALADIDGTEHFVSPYDLIPYAITDGYDSIEEVDEKDDVLFPSFPPRQGPLPSPGYSGLTADEPKPPGVYSRMDHKEKSVEDEKSDIDEQKLESDTDGTKSDLSMLSDAEEPTMKTTKRSNSYLDLTTGTVEDTEAEGEDIPSAYLKINDDIPSAYLKITDDIPSAYLKITDDIPSAYLKITDDSSQFNTNNKTDTNQDTNSYLELISKSDKEIEYDNNEIPSAYLRITDDTLQATTNSNEEMPSSYLTTREVGSSAI